MWATFFMTNPKDLHYAKLNMHRDKLFKDWIILRYDFSHISGVRKLLRSFKIPIVSVIFRRCYLLWGFELDIFSLFHVGFCRLGVIKLTRSFLAWFSKKRNKVSYENTFLNYINTFREVITMILSNL